MTEGNFKEIKNQYLNPLPRRYQYSFTSGALRYQARLVVTGECQNHASLASFQQEKMMR